MDILQCRICSKPFQSFGGKTCTNCLEEMEMQYIKVRDYIYDNPYNSEIDKISAETEVPHAAILQMLKDGRLMIRTVDGDSGLLSCEICKRPIGSGKMCDDCKNQVAEELQRSLESKMPPPETKKKGKASNTDSRMHIRRTGD